MSRWSATALTIAEKAVSGPGRYTMAVMCSMQACVAKAGLCAHEKVMLGVAALVVAGLGAYFFLT
jgi:hypothetical protein